MYVPACVDQGNKQWQISETISTSEFGAMPSNRKLDFNSKNLPFLTFWIIRKESGQFPWMNGKQYLVSAHILPQSSTISRIFFSLQAPFSLVVLPKNVTAQVGCVADRISRASAFVLVAKPLTRVVRESSWIPSRGNMAVPPATQATAQEDLKKGKSTTQVEPMHHAQNKIDHRHVVTSHYCFAHFHWNWHCTGL